MIVQYFFSKYTFISDYRKENCSMPLDDLDVHYLDYNEDSIHYVLSCLSRGIEAIKSVGSFMPTINL